MKIVKMKPVTPEMKSKFFKCLCEIIANKLNLEVVYNVQNGIHNFIYFANETYSSDEILKIINNHVSNELRCFIETETGDNPKEYDRSIALFESVANDVNLTITW